MNRKKKEREGGQEIGRKRELEREGRRDEGEGKGKKQTISKRGRVC